MAEPNWLPTLIREEQDMKHAAHIFALSVSLSMAACGGSGSSNSCTDACNHAISCATQQNITAPSPYDNDQDCIAACNAGNCTTKQNAIDCVVELSCNANIVANVEGCISNAGCSF
jgi:hypothetical protein